MNATTEGYLLGGRVRHVQPATGFRTGIEPVLLAAAIAARPGARVLEGGSGSGAALLCLAARVSGLTGCGIEVDPAQAALAAANVAANGFDGIDILCGDIATIVPEGVFDHAMANPPYHEADGTVSPDVARARAKRGSADLLGVWARALTRPLRARGTLTFILPAARLPSCMEALRAAGCGVDAILPLWPRQGVAAKLLIVRGVRGGRSPLRLMPGLTLHGPDGRFTPDADAVLRGGGALSLTGR